MRTNGRKPIVAVKKTLEIMGGKFVLAVGMLTVMTGMLSAGSG